MQRRDDIGAPAKRERPSAPRPSGAAWRRHPALQGPFLVINGACFLTVLAVSILPIFYVVYLSVINPRISTGAGKFVGLGNYEFVLEDSTMVNSIWNTLYFSSMSVVIATVVGLAIALLMDSKAPGRAVLMAAVILPWALPEVVNALMWQWVFDASWGVLNGLLFSLGAIDDYIAYFSDGTLAMHVIIFAYSWKILPFVVIIIYAALRSIPEELYESAQLDGAGAGQTFWHITLPLITPAIAVSVLFCVIWSMRAFDLIYVLTRGGPGESTFVLSYYTYWKAFQYADFGAGAAVSVILAALTFVITLVYWWALQRRGDAE